MMELDQFLERCDSHKDDECLVYKGRSFSYGDLEKKRLAWLEVLQAKSITPGTVVGLKAQYSVEAISLLIALLSHRCIAAMIPFSAQQDEIYLQDGQIECLFRFRESEEWQYEHTAKNVDHPLLLQLRQNGIPGFMIFTSGSTGHPKAVLHSLKRFLVKFKRAGKKFRTLTFLLFDHIAGLDTLFYTLNSGGAMVLPERRDPRSICRLIQDHHVEVLPASPTFLNLLCLSGDYEDFDLSSLKIITYGSEPMSQSTLNRLGQVFPNARIIQKYGTSEFGSPRALSRRNDSLWLKLKTDELDAKIVDGVLWVRAETAMLGYLNAPSPFDDEGWYCTGDLIEQDGEWIHILGRKSDIIIVGGEKVYPQEVEAAILELDFIQDVLVKGESNPLTGQIVKAQVNLMEPMEDKMVLKEVRKHCRKSLEPYKIPVKVDVLNTSLATDRQKKIRR